MPAWMKVLGALCLSAVVANGIMVWKTLNGRHDLIRADYYEAGLDQDGLMARVARAEATGMRIGFAVEGGEFRVEARLSPGPEAGSEAASPLRSGICRLEFYRPDDAAADRRAELVRETGTDPHAGTWRAPAFPLRQGPWNIRLLWMDGDRPVMEKTLRYQSP